jgi:hypothetical protein
MNRLSIAISFAAIVLCRGTSGAQTATASLGPHLSVVSRPTASADLGSDALSWLQFIGLELRQLRVEFLEHCLSEEAAKAPQLEPELAALHLEQGKKQREEGFETRQLDELEKQLGQSSGDPQAREQIQAAKNEHASNAEIARAAQASLITRVAELNERLRAAKARIQSIADRLKQLSAPGR